MDPIARSIRDCCSLAERIGEHPDTALGDVRPERGQRHPPQPPLPDGIHLRWAFERTAGFPWYGYYLFRRPHLGADRQSIKVTLQHLAAGSLGSATLTTAAAIISSDTVLVATDDLPPAGLAELDLSGRSWLRVNPADLAAEVEVEVGFVQAGEMFGVPAPLKRPRKNRPITQLRYAKAPHYIHISM